MIRVLIAGLFRCARIESNTEWMVRLPKSFLEDNLLINRHFINQNQLKLQVVWPTMVILVFALKHMDKQIEVEHALGNNNAHFSFSDKKSQLCTLFPPTLLHSSVSH